MSDIALLKRSGLHLYRRLLRAQRSTFQGDLDLIKAAHLRTRTEFESARNIPMNKEEMERKLKEGNEICEFIKHNLIQARRKDDPNYYSLIFRPEVEINDGHMKGKIGKCC